MESKIENQLEPIKSTTWFVSHLAVLFSSWAAPFLVSWYWLIPIYGMVLLQFKVFGRCVMNREHGVNDESSDHTFYADIMERLGLKVNRRKVKRFVRSWIYLVLLSVGIVWQVVLGKTPLWF